MTVMQSAEPAAVLTLNAGSSSLKFAMFAAGEPPRQLLSGQIERIGGKDTALSVRRDGGVRVHRLVAVADHTSAASTLLDWLARETLPPLVAIGHRLVHGGPEYVAPERVTPRLLAALHRLCPLAPTHLPVELALLDACARVFPQLPQVACFDTAFHSTLPRVARIFALPRRLEAHGVRRYGFHGLSYTFLLAELGRVAGVAAARGRVILAHLGSGASLAAVRDGACIDTSMGFTPAAGLPMGTRAGDLDPGVVQYLLRTQGMTAEQFDHMIHHESGLLGVSERSSDLRELLAQKDSDPRADDAVALFCYQTRKWIGAYAAALGGLDTLVFSGGIGEHAPAVRARICAELGFLGIRLDESCNTQNAPLISADHSQVAVRVIATDEQRVIAEAVYQVLGRDY